MNSEKTDSNTRAARNGKAIEEYVQRLLPNIKFLNGQFDAVYDGTLLEIKSCQATVVDNSHNNTHRSGRFVFQSEQHNALLKAGGEYLFVVHVDENPLISFREIAEDVGLPDFSGVKSVAWRSVARSFVEGF